VPTAETLRAREFIHRPTTVAAVQYWPGVEREVQAILTGWGVTWFPHPDGRMRIASPQGSKPVNPGDWLVRGILNEVWPVGRAVFEGSYDVRDD
jgi:hypothetical protein